MHFRLIYSISRTTNLKNQVGTSVNIFVLYGRDDRTYLCCDESMFRAIFNNAIKENIVILFYNNPYSDGPRLGHYLPRHHQPSQCQRQ